MLRITLASTGLVVLILVSIVSAAHADTAPRGGNGVNATFERPDRLFEEERLLSTPGPAAGIRRYGAWPVERAPQGTGDETTGAVADTEPTSQGAVPLGPGIGANFKISNGVGPVDNFAVSPDGTTVVFTEDVGATTNLLFSVPIDGSAAPTQLSSGLGIGSPNDGVTGFAISPDNSRVIFIADTNATTGTDTDFFTVPIDGSMLPAVRLNVNAPAPVTVFGFTPDGTTAAFFAPDVNFSGASVELHAVPADGSAPDRQLSDVDSTLPGLGNVVTADFSSDSQWMIYAADDAVDDLFQWFSVPAGATGPGLDNQLSNAITTVAFEEISSDSTTMAYTGDDITSGIQEVFAVPIGGGVPIRLNPPGMLGDGVSNFAISDDNFWVSYLGEGNTAGVTEVYSAILFAGGSGLRISFPMLAGQQATTLNISPDSTTVLYESDQNVTGTFELFRVPIDGSAGPLVLHPATSPDSVGFFTGSGTPIIGRRALFPVFGATVDLFSVPFDGSESSVQLNDVLAPGDALFSGFFSFDRIRLMAYGGGPSTGSVVDEINSVPIRRDFPPEQINGTAPLGANGVGGYVIGPQENYGVYIQDQDTIGLDELFVRELDTDGDLVVNPADNCPFLVNPGQAPQIFPDTVRVEANKTTFVWPTRLEARYVRGPLATVSTYAINDSGAVLDAVSYDDSATPGANTGWFYIFAHDCDGRSYQTVLGDEPGRDLAPLP